MAGQESNEKPHIPIHTQRSTTVDKDKQRKELERQVKNLRIDFAVTFGSPEGHRVLKWIIQESGFNKNNVGGNPALGMDVLQGTLYNCARGSLYLEMRQFIPAETLKLVEYENVQEILE